MLTSSLNPSYAKDLRNLPHESCLFRRPSYMANQLNRWRINVGICSRDVRHNVKPKRNEVSVGFERAKGGTDVKYPNISERST